MGTHSSTGRRAVSSQSKRRKRSSEAAGTPGGGELARPVTLPPRPFEPGRAEPPVPITDDLEELVGPPLHGKAHPPADMDEVKPSLDDEQRYHHHAGVGEATVFGFDPDAADAAADLAGDLGSTFLEGATSGEDVSDATMEREEREDSEVPFLIDEELDPERDEDAELVASPPLPTRRAKRR